jgi:hypothetical protein
MGKTFSKNAKRIALVALMCIFAFALAACKKKDVSVNIYPCGEDTLAVLVKGDVCEKLIAPEGAEWSDYKLYLYVEEPSANISMNAQGANLFVSATEEEEYWSVDAWKTWKLTKDSFFFTLNKEGLAHFFDNSKKATLKLYQKDAEEKLLLNVNIPKVIEKIDTEKLAEIAGTYLYEDEVSPDWTGKYLSFYKYLGDDREDNLSGEINVEVKDGNILYITANINGEEKVYVAREEEQEDYFDGSMHYAVVLLNASDKVSDVDITLYGKTTAPDGKETLQIFMFVKDMETEESISTTFYKAE